MREILFRGKQVNNGEWVEGFYAKTIQGSSVIFNIIDENPCGFCIEMFDSLKNYVVVSETVGQYTGLTDKNGKKIFEGDLVKAYNICGEEEGMGIVHWSELFVAWHYANNKCMYGDNIASYEVIGNIHDNPELIEEV